MIFQHLSHCCEVLSLLAYHPEPMLDSPPALVSQQAPRAGKGRQVGRWAGGWHQLTIGAYSGSQYPTSVGDGV